MNIYNVVYIFLDNQNNCLYVGKTSNLENRLKAHKHRSDWYDKAYRIVTYVFKNSFIASSLEPLIVASRRPINNKDLLTEELSLKEALDLKSLIKNIESKYSHTFKVTTI